MKKVSGNLRLLRRQGVYYYRRRVSRDLVAAVGSKFIQFSLGTKSVAEARKLRTAKDLEWDARFNSYAKQLASHSQVAGSTPPNIPAPSEEEVVQLVRAYVEQMD